MTISELKKDAREKLKGRWGSAICMYIAYSLFIFLIGFVSGFLDGIFGKNSVITFGLQILLIIICLPLTFGFLVSMVKLYRGESVGYFSFVSTGFSNIYNAWKVFGRTLLKLALPIILVVLTDLFLAVSRVASVITSGSVLFSILPPIALILFIAAYIFAIVKSLYYVLGNLILCDNPELTGKEIVEKSAEMMKGNRMKYFLLILSFIGWILLIYLIFYAFAFMLSATLANVLSKIIPLIIALVSFLVLSCYITFSMISFYEDLNDVIPTSSSINQSGSAETITENTIE